MFSPAWPHDNVFRTTAHEKISVIIEIPDIFGIEPPVLIHYGSGFLRILVISLHHNGTSCPKRSHSLGIFVSKLYLYPGNHRADRFVFGFFRVGTCEQRGSFGQSVTDTVRELRFPEELLYQRRKTCTAYA